MRPLLCVVDDVGSEHPFEMTPTVDQHVVEALGTDCPHGPLGEGVGPRSTDRRADHPDGFGLENGVEQTRELGVSVVHEEPDSLKLISDRQVPGLLGDPRRVGMGGRSGHEDAPGREVDEHKDIQGLQGDRLHGKEVACQDACGLGPQELRPGGAGPARSRIEAVAEQDGTDGRRRYPYVQLEQLASDPLVPPPGILAGEAKDEVGGLTVERRPTGLAFGLEGPFPPHQLAMPPQERVGPDDEG